MTARLTPKEPPHRLFRLLGLALAGTVVVSGAVASVRPQRADAAPGPCANASTPVASLSQADAEDAVLCLTNVERTTAGLPDLTLNAQLASAARDHAQAAVNQKWWVARADPHTNPATSSTPMSRILAAGYCPAPVSWKVAENAFWQTPNATPEDAVNWWMGSPGHRANILDPGLSELGVGVVVGGAAPDGADTAGTFVQNFGNCVQ
jgi:uncharacterized protein YkwD